MLPPDERQARIRDLTADEARRPVLVATDCLSEGVNLQEHFQAVVHYDLAWNPTRHEQREGRVDRFGQRAHVVRAVTCTAPTTASTGSSWTCCCASTSRSARPSASPSRYPTAATTWSRPSSKGCCCATRPASSSRSRASAWKSAPTCTANGTAPPPRERQSRTKYAQAGIQPAEVARELAEMRASLGTPGEVAAFTAEALSALHADITPIPSGFRAATGVLPAGLRDALVTGHAEPLPFHRDLPVPPREAYLDRTDPNVAAIARYVLESALDPRCPRRRCAPRGAAA